MTDPIFSENTYIAQLGNTTGCLVIDPGLESAQVVERIEQLGLTPQAILNTHGHYDHIAGNAAVKDRWPECPLAIGAKDAEKLIDAEQNLSAAYGLPVTSPPADILLHEPDVYSAAGFELRVLETPGHSVGHVVFVWEKSDPAVIFGGDVLFQGSVGRTDFPDGSFEDLVASIQQKLFTLADDTIVLPGHGPQTTIGYEKTNNPFVGAPARLREEFPGQ